MALRVAIAIVSYKTPKDVADCLAALSQSLYPHFNLVICENGGAAAFAALTAALPTELPGGQTVRAFDAGSNLGYAGGVNRCIAASPDADAWWVLNPDTAPDPDALGGLVARLEAGDCQAVGGTIRLADGQIQAYGGRWQPWLARAVSLGHGQAGTTPPSARRIEAQQNFLNGASMLIGRAFWETTGPMREDYFLYCEEVEWCLRGAQRGMRLGFAPIGTVIHKQGTSTGNSTDLRARSRLSVYLNERNRLLLTRDLLPALFPVAIVTVLATLAARFGKRLAWRQLGYALQGWAAGISGSRGAPTLTPASRSEAKGGDAGS